MIMKNRKLFYLTFFIFLLSTTSAAYADVIEPGMKQVNLNYQISNINDYPDYVFLLRGIPYPDIEIINSSKFSFYKLSNVSIYAIKRDDFDASIINKSSEEIQSFFENNSKLIKSDISLEGSYGDVKIENPLKEATIILEIKDINSTNLIIEKSKIIYTFEDGSQQEEIIKDQNDLPEPSKGINLADYWWIFLGVLIILVIVIMVIIKRFR
ncbi:MAG: hypothetical protein QME14_00445 [Methanobacteriaceae archaeon]|nr:hypothetical protein [Methanobacteriaceae archaeon]